MTEGQRDILIAKMIDSPSSLTDSEIDIIAHDDELKGIYEMSAALCGAYTGCPKIDMPKEWALFSPKQTKKPLISRRVLQVAAIFIGVILTSYVVINIVGIDKGSDQNPEIANIAPMQEKNTDGADSRIAYITQERIVAQSSNMDDAKVRIAAASPHLIHNGQSAITSSKDLSELDPPQQSHLVMGPGSVPKSHHHSAITEEPKETMHASAIKNNANDSTFILPPEDPWVYDTAISNDEYMDLYRQSLKSIDIHLTPPEGFAQGKKIWPRPYLFSPNIGGYKSDIFSRCDNVTSSCASPYFSASGDAIVLYPSQIIYTVHGVLPDYRIESELMLAYANDSIDCTSLVKRIPGKEALGNTNADWVNIYEFDMGQPIQGKYSHCVGIALRKYNNYPFMIKLVMSDEGLKHKDKYIRAILNSVRYGNTTNKIMEESEKRVPEMEIPEGTYPRILPEYTKMNNQK